MNSPSDDARDLDVTGDEWERWAADAFARVLDARPALTPADLAAELLRGVGADLDLDPVRVEAAVVECRRRLRAAIRPVGGEPMTDDDVVRRAAELAAPLRALVGSVAAGEVTAGPLARAYLAGALAALDALAEGRPVPSPDLL